MAAVEKYVGQQRLIGGCEMNTVRVAKIDNEDV